LPRYQAEEEQASRGKLKIFLGYVAGVGKTYAMLEAAHQRLDEGVDVVVGYAETHSRKETETLLSGLEILPRRQVDYRGTTLSEMDLDGILARHPQLVLVDELAHTNAPGSRHPKRYMDVEELLNAGIDVYSTVNIQHLESLVDVVQQITGVIVREKIPDRLLDEADEIELIDLPTNELLQRLKDGKVYISDQAMRPWKNSSARATLPPCVNCPCAARPTVWTTRCSTTCSMRPLPAPGLPLNEFWSASALTRWPSGSSAQANAGP